MRLCTGFIYISTYEHRSELLGSIRGKEFLEQVKKLLAFQEELSSGELGSLRKTIVVVIYFCIFQLFSPPR
jgi:hypothetical protein